MLSRYLFFLFGRIQALNFSQRLWQNADALLAFWRTTPNSSTTEIMMSSVSYRASIWCGYTVCDTT